MCITVVSRRRTPQVMRIARTVDDEVLSTVEDIRQTTLIRKPATTEVVPGSYTGWRAVLKKK